MELLKTRAQARDADEEAEFLAEYRRRRMEEMRRSLEASATRFDGLGVVELTAANFLQHVDPPNVPANATVVLHVFEAREPACRRLNRCLEELGVCAVLSALCTSCERLSQ